MLPVTLCEAFWLIGTERDPGRVSSKEHSGGDMSGKTDVNECYHVIVRRGAMGLKRRVMNRKPFVWEIRHKDTTHLLESSAEQLPAWKKLISSALPRLHA